MRTPPQDLPEAEVGIAVAARWYIVAERIEYAADLKDLCGSASWFTGPHQRTMDTELAWQGSIKICHRLATNGR